MDPDRKQTENDNIMKEYHEEIIAKSWSKTLKTVVAITTLILAVVGTLASFKAASLGNQVVISQNEAFNHWSHYQSKTIKKTTLETELYNIEIELAKTDLTDNPQLQQELEAKKAAYAQEIARYQTEEQEISRMARLAEQKHVAVKDVSAGFGNALIFLQIGILLSSLTAISKIKYYWYMGFVTGIIGFGLFINSYYNYLTL